MASAAAFNSNQTVMPADTAACRDSSRARSTSRDPILAKHEHEPGPKNVTRGAKGTSWSVLANCLPVAVSFNSISFHSFRTTRSNAKYLSSQIIIVQRGLPDRRLLRSSQRLNISLGECVRCKKTVLRYESAGGSPRLGGRRGFDSRQMIARNPTSMAEAGSLCAQTPLEREKSCSRSPRAATARTASTTVAAAAAAATDAVADAADAADAAAAVGTILHTCQLPSGQGCEGSSGGGNSGRR